MMENWDPFCEAGGRMDGLWISTNQDLKERQDMAIYLV